MPVVVRAFPLRRPQSEFDAFVQQMEGARRAEATAFYRQHGIDHESWHLQQTEQGAWVIVVSMVRDPAGAAPRYAQANDAFSGWFKGRVLELSGVDPNVAPLGPPTKEVYRWSDNAELANLFTVYSAS
jgi:hypothetical protein